MVAERLDMDVETGDWRSRKRRARDGKHSLLQYPITDRKRPVPEERDSATPLRFAQNDGVGASLRAE